MAETYTGEAYWVKCKEKRHFTGVVKVSESGRRMAQGYAPPPPRTKVNRTSGQARLSPRPRSGIPGEGGPVSEFPGYRPVPRFCCFR